MKRILPVIGFLAAAFPALAKDDMTCGPAAEAEKFFNSQGFRHLLDMTSKEKVVQNIWIADQKVIITAVVPKEHPEDQEMLCVLAGMDHVRLNADTLEGIVEALHKQQKKI